MSKDRSSRNIIKTSEKKVIKNPSRVIQLKECPRVLYSDDMPLKKPTRKCVFRVKNKRRCIAHPSLWKYLHNKNIEYDFWSIFKCCMVLE